MKIDLHVHSKYSYDSSLTLEQIINKVKEGKIDGLAMTDHNEIQGGLELQKIADFPVIVGEEIYSQDGHIIGLFLKEKIKPGLSGHETIRRIKAQGGLVLIPHPFDLTRHGKIRTKFLMKVLDQIDFLETYNSRTIWPGTQNRTKRFAKKHKLIMTAGSDGHGKLEFGRCGVIIDKFDGPQDFKEKMKSAQFFNGHNTVWAYVLSTLAMIAKLKRFFKKPK
jgi:predicted metal-dependent phosphoesterase TrpH